eukprot:11131330-Lingulodinium_polyedra.AAC.1
MGTSASAASSSSARPQPHVPWELAGGDSATRVGKTRCSAMHVTGIAAISSPSARRAWEPQPSPARHMGLCCSRRQAGLA